MKEKKKIVEEFRVLTRAEEEVMQVLWELGEGLVHDVLQRFPEPKPAYNTVSTIIRILEQKGFADHKAYGRTYVYFPLVSKKDYTRSYFKNMISGYFGNSYKALASFFASEEELGLKELEEIRNMIDIEIKNQKSKIKDPASSIKNKRP